ncbi:hypothetical protein M407DRAFT_8127 [Tulasnella calospora MUT 4182]|uniref:Uncharacterized protein n=1 Tax=Tulasnella calospora MUT 4182 TaxID=1051891 RepID=A0A0C3QHB0_9AGAM|nr:hypothetical protein M407DRAFT_8127 [Tulasnella calospora MUT 4182]
MASPYEDGTISSTPRTQYSGLPGNMHHRPSRHYPRRRSSLESSNSTVVSGISSTSPLLGRHGKFATDVPTNAQPTSDQYEMYFKYPNRTLPPLFTRKHVTLIALTSANGKTPIGGTIG